MFLYVRSYVVEKVTKFYALESFMDTFTQRSYESSWKNSAVMSGYYNMNIHDVKALKIERNYLCRGCCWWYTPLLSRSRKNESTRSTRGGE